MVRKSGPRTVDLMRASRVELEPIALEVVVSAKENPMTSETDALCEDLRAWMKSPAIGLQEYSADPDVQRRVGRMLARFRAKALPDEQRMNDQFYTDLFSR
jgi:hypothetical protein